MVRYNENILQLYDYYRQKNLNNILYDYNKWRMHLLNTSILCKKYGRNKVKILSDCRPRFY